MSAKVKEAAVRVGGRLRTLRIDFNAICEIESHTGWNLLDPRRSTLEFRNKDLRALCFACLQSGARAEKKRVDFTLEDVGDWLGGEAAADLTAAALELIAPAMPEEEPEEEGEENPPEVPEATKA